jgi:hypothetical protein
MKAMVFHIGWANDLHVTAMRAVHRDRCRNAERFGQQAAPKQGKLF